MTDKDIAIKVENLTKTYKLYDKPIDRLKESLHWRGKKYHKDFHALNDVSFEIKKGDTVGIIGKNGSGKSTLLKIITGVLTQTSGNVTVNGRISALLELGAGFNPEYTGLENIYFQGSIMGYERDEVDTKIKDILDFADIGEFIHQPVKTYSSGMFARLAFAVAIHVEPEILIVDEALSVGDVFFQQKCNQYMQNKMRDVTKIIVTHDISAMQNMCNNLILLDLGNLLFNGKCEEGVKIYLKQLHDNNIVTKTGDWSKLSENIVEHHEWRDSTIEQLGGSRRAEIKKYYYEINGNPFQNSIQSGDEILFRIKFSVYSTIENLIMGCAFFDKFNNQIFGETSFSILKDLKISPGDYSAEFKMLWPQVKQIDYFCTIGLGDGYDDMNHEILCWLYNAIHVKPIDPISVHGFFNNELIEIKVL